MFDLVDVALDEIAFFVDRLVVVDLNRPRSVAGYDSGAVGLGNVFANDIAVVGLVGEDIAEGQAADKVSRPGCVADLTGG